MARLWQYGNEQGWPGPAGVGWTGYFPFDPYSGVIVQLTQDFAVDGSNSLEITCPLGIQYPYGGPYKFIDEVNYTSYPTLHYRFYFALPAQIPAFSNIGRFAWISTVPINSIDGSTGPYEENGVVRLHHALISVVYGRNADGDSYFTLESWRNDARYAFSEMYLLKNAIGHELAPYEPLCIELAYNQALHEGYLFLNGNPEAVLAIDVASDGWMIDPNSTSNPSAGRVSNFAVTPSEIIPRPLRRFIDAMVVDTGFIGPIVFGMGNLEVTVLEGAISPVPVKGAAVKVVEAGLEVQTDSSGVAVFALPPGDYTVNVRHPIPYWPVHEETVTIIQDQTVELTVPFIQNLLLTIHSAVGGITDPAAGIYNYPEGSTVKATAYPDEGYVAKWDLDGVSYTDNPISVYMDGHHDLTPVFTSIPTHILTVNSNITGIEFNIRKVGEEIMSEVIPYQSPEPGLLEGQWQIIAQSNIEVDGEIWNFAQYEDGSTNPSRIVNLISRLDVFMTYVLEQPPPPWGMLDIHAFYQGLEVNAPGAIIETGETFITPIVLQVTPGHYTVEIVYAGIVQRMTAIAVEGQTIRVDVIVAPPTPSLRRLVAPIASIGTGITLLVLASKHGK